MARGQPPSTRPPFPDCSQHLAPYLPSHVSFDFDSFDFDLFDFDFDFFDLDFGFDPQVAAEVVAARTAATAAQQADGSSGAAAAVADSTAGATATATAAPAAAGAAQGMSAAAVAVSRTPAAAPPVQQVRGQELFLKRVTRPSLGSKSPTVRRTKPCLAVPLGFALPRLT